MIDRPHKWLYDAIEHRHAVKKYMLAGYVLGVCHGLAAAALAAVFVIVFVYGGVSCR